MVVIRLARGGRKKYPVYRVVAAEAKYAPTGRFLEILGHYNPHTKDLVLKKAEIEKRLSNGAQPSHAVVKLFQKGGIELPAWVKIKTYQPKPKVEEAPPADDEKRVAKEAAENAAGTQDEALTDTELDTAAGNDEMKERVEEREEAAVENAAKAAKES